MVLSCLLKPAVFRVTHVELPLEEEVVAIGQFDWLCAA